MRQHLTEHDSTAEPTEAPKQQTEALGDGNTKTIYSKAKETGTKGKRKKGVDLGDQTQVYLRWLRGKDKENQKDHDDPPEKKTDHIIASDASNTAAADTIAKPLAKPLATPEDTAKAETAEEQQVSHVQKLDPARELIRAIKEAMVGSLTKRGGPD